MEYGQFLASLAGRYVWAAATGAALVWRAKANQLFPVEARYADGSYSTLRWNTHCRSLCEFSKFCRTFSLNSVAG